MLLRARAIVAVTDSDEKNLLASLLGRQLGIPKVITRVTSAANRRVFERVGIDVPLSARGAAMEAVLHMIRHKEVDLLATMGGGHGEVLEITLPEGLHADAAQGHRAAAGLDRRRPLVRRERGASCPAARRCSGPATTAWSSAGSSASRKCSRPSSNEAAQRLLGPRPPHAAVRRSCC